MKREKNSTVPLYSRQKTDRKMIMNANYPGLLKYTYKKKKKSISTSLNPHLLLVPLRNKDEEE